MRYRRRKGLGSRGRRRQGPPGGEGGRSGRQGRRPGGDGGDGHRGRGGAEGGGRTARRGRTPWALAAKRAAAALALFVLLAGAGYLLAAWWLFPSAESGPAGRLVEVPDLVGLTLEEARTSLAASGLELRERASLSHPSAPSGAVVAQSPLPGQFARPGAPVDVTLSLGPERRVVPDLGGLTDRQGRIVLERLGFRTSLDSVDSPVERGRIVGTRPGTGTEVTLPDRVTLVVSRGPRVGPVPELVGLHIDDVEQALEERGFRLGEVQWDPEAFAARGRVVGQSPEPGYALREGGRVSVRVAGPAPADVGGETPPAGSGTPTTVSGRAAPVDEGPGAGVGRPPPGEPGA